MPYVDEHLINVTDLEGEWLRQPGLLHYYLIQVAEAQRMRAEATADMDVLWAKEYPRCRELVEASIAKGKTPTETMIRQTLINEAPEYTEIQSILRDLDYKISVLKAGRDKIDQRKTALENITRLQLADWYSKPQLKDKEGRWADREQERNSLEKEVPKKRATPRKLGGG